MSESEDDDNFGVFNFEDILTEQQINSDAEEDDEESVVEETGWDDESVRFQTDEEYEIFKSQIASGKKGTSQSALRFPPLLFYELERTDSSHFRSFQTHCRSRKSQNLLLFSIPSLKRRMILQLFPIRLLFYLLVILSVNVFCVLQGEMEQNSLEDPALSAKSHVAMSMEQNMAYLLSVKIVNNDS
jgi:hypothetical protein